MPKWVELHCAGGEVFLEDSGRMDLNQKDRARIENRARLADVLIVTLGTDGVKHQVDYKLSKQHERQRLGTQATRIIATEVLLIVCVVFVRQRTQLVRLRTADRANEFLQVKT